MKFNRPLDMLPTRCMFPNIENTVKCDMKPYL